jgi:hypothetical protein
VRALAAARETLYQQGRGKEEASEPAATLAQQQADALALLMETALHHELDPGAPGERYQVVVHVDAPALANPEHPGQSVLDGGTPSAEPSMWLCHSPSLLKLDMLTREEPEVGSVTGAKEPVAEPDPGASRYPIVSTQRRAL